MGKKQEKKKEVSVMPSKKKKSSKKAKPVVKASTKLVLRKEKVTKSIKATSKQKTDDKRVKSPPKDQRVEKKSATIKKEVKQNLRNAKLILEPSKRKKIRKTKVFLEGDLNINNVDAFMSQIEPIFDDYDFIDFFQREVTSLDLCHMQMLYYFQNHPTRKGKTVTVDSDLPSDLKKVVTNAGFKEFMFIPKLV